MAIFDSDHQGFLIGRRLRDREEDLLEAHSRAFPVWRAIRSDVRAIARQLGVQPPAAHRIGGSTPRAPLVVAEPAGRRGTPRSTGAAASAPLVQRATSARSSVAVPQRDGRGRFVGRPSSVAGVVDEGMRDARGRFTAGGGKAGDGGGGKKDEAGAGTGAALVRGLAGVAERLQRAGSSMGGSAENLDPTLNAAREVRDAVAPLGRGLGGLFGRNAERKKERWYQRIWKALTDKKKTAAGGIVAVSAGGGAGATLASGLAGAAGGLLRRGGAALRMGGGLLRRVPLLGALLSGGMALGGALGLNDDPGRSPEENRAMRYRSAGQVAGMGVGGVVGGVLGSLLGPLGTLGGAWLGSMVGEKLGGALGDWTKTLIDADVPEKIAAYVGAAWDSVTADVKSTLSAVSSTLTNAAGAVAKWVKDKTGVDVVATSKGAWETTKSVAANAAGAAAAFVAENAPRLVPETLKRAAAAGERAIGGMLGISRVVESGKGYNVVERSDGSVVRQDGARNWRNNNPGNIEFRPWMTEKYGATSDGRFAIFPTYEAGRRAQEALFFEGKGYRGLKLSDAIARWAPPSENDTAAYQASVLASVGGIDKPTSQYNAAERRAIMDAKQRVEGFKVGTVTPVRPAATQLGPVAAAKVPAMTASDVPKMPEVKEPSTRINSEQDRKLTVEVKKGDGLSQDVPDRSLAHIVTGGIGGA